MVALTRSSKSAQVLVLRTNVHSPRLVQFLAPLLNRLPAVRRWTLDHEDIDNILRIEADGDLTETLVIQTLASRGFDCAPLPD